MYAWSTNWCVYWEYLIADISQMLLPSSDGLSRCVESGNPPQHEAEMLVDLMNSICSHRDC